MKKIMILTIMIIATEAVLSQNAKTAVSNHAFIMCDDMGSPISASGQFFYFVFYSNSEVIMLCGSSLDKAIKNRKIDPSTSKSGKWQSNNNKLWFTWSDGKRSEDWMLNPSSGNFRSGNALLKDLGKF